MRESRLPVGGENVFVKLKESCRAAIADGKKLTDLSIGQPKGPALWSARLSAAHAIKSVQESMHAYQDNDAYGVPGFGPAFVQFHVKRDLSEVQDIAYLPTAGTKTILPLIPIACGAINGESINVKTMTNPGYPVPAYWCKVLNINNIPFTTNSANSFSIDLKDITEDTDLIMINYPHNPSGQISRKLQLQSLCAFCEEKGIRLFNDAAYSMIAGEDSCTLLDVAVDFPRLSYGEAFSSSKIGNFTGWRVGCVGGSPDFVKDIASIQGNANSGFNAALATGILHCLKTDMKSVKAVREVYSSRIDLLTNILTDRGMKIAVKPEAGFFTLFELPNKAFGEDIRNAEHFNSLMIEKVGVVGVPFHPYIRYAVVSKIESAKLTNSISRAFDKARVEY